ncbi:hypothetical protein HDU91_005958 [Kappamyces sp. JEL0680]|nr:hypothetical protein HDU91_005958 [Kappamyces sp. JEL0680]
MQVSLNFVCPFTIPDYEKACSPSATDFATSDGDFVRFESLSLPSSPRKPLQSANGQHHAPQLSGIEPKKLRASPQLPQAAAEATAAVSPPYSRPSPGFQMPAPKKTKPSESLVNTPAPTTAESPFPTTAGSPNYGGRQQYASPMPNQSNSPNNTTSPPAQGVQPSPALRQGSMNTAQMNTHKQPSPQQTGQLLNQQTVSPALQFQINQAGSSNLLSQKGAAAAPTQQPHVVFQQQQQSQATQNQLQQFAAQQAAKQAAQQLAAQQYQQNLKSTQQIMPQGANAAFPTQQTGLFGMAQNVQGLNQGSMNETLMAQQQKLKLLANEKMQQNAQMLMQQQHQQLQQQNMFTLGQAQLGLAAPGVQGMGQLGQLSLQQQQLNQIKSVNPQLAQQAAQQMQFLETQKVQHQQHMNNNSSSLGNPAFGVMAQNQQQMMNQQQRLSFVPNQTSIPMQQIPQLPSGGQTPQLMQSQMAFWTGAFAWNVSQPTGQQMEMLCHVSAYPMRSSMSAADWYADGLLTVPSMISSWPNKISLMQTTLHLSEANNAKLRSNDKIPVVRFISNPQTAQAYNALVSQLSKGPTAIAIRFHNSNSGFILAQMQQNNVSSLVGYVFTKNLTIDQAIALLQQFAQNDQQQAMMGITGQLQQQQLQMQMQGQLGSQMRSQIIPGNMMNQPCRFRRTKP